MPVSQPHNSAISPDGRTAYVTNEGSNDVSVVDLASQQVVATAPVGNGPRKIAVLPGQPTAASAGAAQDGMATASPAHDGMSMAHEGMAMTPQDHDGMAMGSRAQAESALAGAPPLTFNDHGIADVRGLDEIDVEADDDYFSPTFLRGAPGQRLKLVVENESASLHNLSIPGLGIDTNIAPHASVEVEVTFPQSGATTFFCKLHTALGMNGALLVEDAAP